MFSMHNALDDGGILGRLNIFCDLVLLNLLFLVSCLPVFTIGAAVSGMYYVNLKLIREEEGSIWKTYWKGFRSSFRSATVCWLTFLALLGILVVDYWILPVMIPALYPVARVMVGIVFIFACALMLYLLPILAWFVCSGKQALKNALLMLFGHFPYTLLLLLLHGIFPVLSALSEPFFLYASCLFLVCGASVLNLISSRILSRIFKNYETV